MEFFGVELVGFSAENGRKLVLTAGGIVLLWALGRALVFAARRLLPHGRAFFWARQGVRLAVAILVFLAVVSIWFDDPARLATGLGLVTAGLAFALQKVITALAGYFVILRGQTFNVGDRITMGGVRGDVSSRQYTGRVVTVSNARVFDEPVYNYTREFPYLWEEMSVPVPYQADHAAAEQILLQVAGRHTVQTSQLGESALRDMEKRYFVKASDMGPAVFYRLTDNWLELTVRFIAPTHAIRELKDAMTRDILRALAGAGIRIASTTIEIVGR